MKRELRRPKPTPPYAWATEYVVVGTRGKTRAVLVVRCPHCQHHHAHSAPADFQGGKRKAACHGGDYVLLVGTVEGAA